MGYTGTKSAERCLEESPALRQNSDLLRVLALVESRRGRVPGRYASPSPVEVLSDGLGGDRVFTERVRCLIVGTFGELSPDRDSLWLALACVGHADIVCGAHLEPNASSYAVECP